MGDFVVWAGFLPLILPMIEIGRKSRFGNLAKGEWW